MAPGRRRESQAGPQGPPGISCVAPNQALSLNVRRTSEPMRKAVDSWSRAVAYLKAKLPAEGPGPVVSTSYEDSPVLRDLGNGLLVAYLVDEGGHFSYVQNRHLLAAGASEDDLHRVGIDNLSSLAEQYLRVQPYGSIFAVFMEGNFEASVLLLDAVWDTSFAGHVRGGFAAAAPARDVLAFGDLASPQAIAELQAVIGRLGADHLLSTSLFRRRGATWVANDA